MIPIYFENLPCRFLPLTHRESAEIKNKAYVNILWQTWKATAGHGAEGGKSRRRGAEDSTSWGKSRALFLNPTSLYIRSDLPRPNHYHSRCGSLRGRFSVRSSLSFTSHACSFSAISIWHVLQEPRCISYRYKTNKMSNKKIPLKNQIFSIWFCFFE